MSDSSLLLCHFVQLHYCFLLLLGLLNHLCTDVSLILDRYHPDKNVSNPEAAELFKEVAYSYSILSDPEKRRHYDNAGFEVRLFLPRLSLLTSCLYVLDQTYCCLCCKSQSYNPEFVVICSNF